MGQNITPAKSGSSNVHPDNSINNNCKTTNSKLTLKDKMHKTLCIKLKQKMSN